MKTNKVYFENLDALRSIAFLMVFSEHVFWRSFKNVEFGSGIIQHMCYDLLANGRMGVSIFFVLSGFLITYLLLNEQQIFGRINIKNFYVRRTLRIWPLYMAVVLFAFYLYPIIQKLLGISVMSNPADPLMYFTFLSNFDMINIHNAGLVSFMQSGVTWSIAIEEQFYLVWPLLFFIWPKKKLQWLFLIIIASSVTFRYIYAQEAVYIYFHTLGVCGDLAIGGFAAWLSFYQLDKLKLILPKNAWIRILAYTAGVLFVLTNGYFVHAKNWPAFSRLISTLFFAYLILDQNFGNVEKFRLVNLKLFTYWGKLTYGLYLLHPIAFLFNRLWIDYFNINTESFIGNTIFSLITLILTAFFAIISYNFFEKPFLSMKNRFT